MAEEASTRDDVVAPTTSAEVPASDAVTEPQVNEQEAEGNSNGVQNGTSSEIEVATSTAGATEEVKDNDAGVKDETNDKQTIPDKIPDNAEQEPSTSIALENDTEMKDDEQSGAAGTTADESAEPAEPADAASATPASASKSKARRKSGVPEHKKKLNKKQSKARLTHTDAKPGDYFFVRLKGYPLWPAIVCDEDMLPSTLIKSRPVTAMRADGTYRADYEDDGPKAKDRTFPVMYLFTNEFGWIPNYDLLELDLETVGDVPQNMRKDLYAAHQLAAEKHDLDYFKTVLTEFMEAKKAEEEAKEAAKAAKKANKAKKEKAPKAVSSREENEDTEMMDASAIVDDETDAPKSVKKRKTEETDQPESVPKKPRIKLNNTPKATNGTATPKTAKEPKSAKEKKPKKTPAKPKETAPAAPPEPELTPEEKRVKKEKEILFLRHKLQKGLLTKDQAPKEEEMKQMSEYVSKLEGYADLEVSIIRATKINKVLKAILKLPTIPKEEEFQFKPRSQTLLDKWNKLLASEQVAPVATETTAEAVNEDKAGGEEAKAHLDRPNGTAENDENTAEDNSPVLETPLTALPREEVTINEKPVPEAEDSPKAELATVETTT